MLPPPTLAEILFGFGILWQMKILWWNDVKPSALTGENKNG